MATSARKSALQTVRRVLAADLACKETDFLEDIVSINRAEIREGRFQFPIREKSLSIMTMGKGVVVSCNQERLQWVKSALDHLTRGQNFSIHTIAVLEKYVKRDLQFIAGPDQKHICTVDDLAEFYTPQGVKVSTYSQNKVAELYEHLNFKHALSYQVDHPRPDRLAVIAEYDGMIVGIAGASQDCECMWQIGVDVLPAYQGYIQPSIKLCNTGDKGEGIQDQGGKE